MTHKGRLVDNFELIQRLETEMLEKIRDSGYWVLDISLQFFSEQEMTPEAVVRLLELSFKNPPLPTRVLSDKLVLDPNSDYANDKPSFVCPMDEMLDEVRWVFGDEPTWHAEDEQIDAYLAAVPKLEEWYCFARVVLEFEFEYEWDWDEQDGVENFSGGIVQPLFDSIDVDMSVAKGAKLTIVPFEMY